MKSILIVDDRADERDFLKILLELSNYEVIEASNGKEAIIAVQNSQPDLVLMDVAMPQMNGISAIKIIKEQSSNIPIIALTSYGDFFDKMAYESGCDEIIGKPISFKKLDTALKHYL